jgi:iron(III) transport system ATP-binding protein
VLWSLESVSLSGRRLPRLDRVSLEISAGVTAVLGQSGVGKTSLLNVLVGFERPTTGRVTFQASTLAGELPFFWVPPQHGLWSHLSVRDHLTTVLSTNTNDQTMVVDDLLRMFDLLELADTRPGSLSLGERSRLNVVRALASKAQILVMDEPLAHVDSSRSGRYWKAIREHCAEHGTSIVMASHSPEVVLREASRVVCLEAGRVTYSGDVVSLYRQPPSRELAELLGPCNWISTDLQRQLFDRTPMRLNENPCVRPEGIQVEPQPDSPLIIDESRFAGTSAELELRDERSGSKFPLIYRPNGTNRVQRGERVILRLLTIILMLVGMSGCFGNSSPVLSVKHESTWSMPPEGSRVPAPRGMTVSPADEYLVLDNVGRVLVFNENGDLQKQWWMPEYSVGRAEGICVLKDGRIIVADTHYHRCVFFDHEGSVTGMFGQRGSEPGDFVYPVSITQDPEENLYVCEYGQNDRVQKFRPDGTFLLQFGGPGIEPGQFQRPSGIVWYDHRLYVVDAFNNRIQVFNEDGQLISILGESDKVADVHYPYDITVDQHGDLFVVEYGAGRVSKFSRDGRLLGRYGASGSGQAPAQFSTPWGVAIDRRGRLYVCDTGNRRIVELEL